MCMPEQRSPELASTLSNYEQKMWVYTHKQKKKEQRGVELFHGRLPALLHECASEIGNCLCSHYPYQT